VSKLARVLDPEELDRAEGARGRLVVEVPDAWLAGGDTIEVVVPPRVACARCDGGGCDACGRSGALRLPEDEAARTLRLSLPTTAEASIVRLVRPLGPDAGLEQLWLELRAADEASPFCRRLTRASAGQRGYAALARGPLLVAVLLALALVLVLTALLGLR
jgi:hypothetical protein